MEKSQGVRAWIESLGIDPVVGLVVLAGLGYAAVGVAVTVRRTDDRMRVGLITFIGAPFVLLLMIGLVIFFPPYAYMLIRCVFIVLAILIPPSLFFLFIATRRESLFNAYTSNLDRLGLLGARRLSSAESNGGRHLESEASRRRRIKSYLDRFGAVYGTLKADFVDRFLDTTASDQATTDARDVAWMPDESGFELKTILPIIGATVLMTLGWVTTLPVAFDIPDSLQPFGDPYGVKWFNTLVLPIFSPVNFAFLGAYFFSLQMLIRRFVRRDLGPNAYNAVSLRIFLATMGVWVIAQALGDTAKGKEFLVVAFAVGAFPDIVWQFIASTFKKLPGVGWALPSLKTGIPLNMIDGLTVWHEARLEEEDIENVHNLATVDVVDLFLNTKFPPHRIIDWIDQAILLTYLGGDPQDGGAFDKASYARLKRFGLRTATIFVQAWESAKNPSSSLFGGFDAGFNDEQKREYLAIAAAIRTNSNFPLMQTWRGLDDAAQAEPVKEMPQLRTVGQGAA
jgi:hypothetical protein